MIGREQVTVNKIDEEIFFARREFYVPAEFFLAHELRHFLRGQKKLPSSTGAERG
jgi:Zn-dependent peptidase ImmA (M78 family)